MVGSAGPATNLAVTMPGETWFPVIFADTSNVPATIEETGRSTDPPTAFLVTVVVVPPIP
jgi:hypothetical protein